MDEDLAISSLWLWDMGMTEFFNFQMPLVQTQVARWKAAATEQLTGAHLYLDIAKSGYLFHGFSSGMGLKYLTYRCILQRYRLMQRFDN